MGAYGWILMIGLFSPIDGFTRADHQYSGIFYKTQDECRDSTLQANIIDSYMEMYKPEEQVNFRIWCEPLKK
jgi:hypothetical protein